MAGLHLMAEKSQFYQIKVPYLIPIIGIGEVRKDRKNTAAVKDWPVTN